MLVLLLAYTLYQQIWGHDYWASFLSLCTPERWLENWALLLLVLVTDFGCIIWLYGLGLIYGAGDTSANFARQ